MNAGMEWLNAAPAAIDRESERLAKERQATLIKPPGALGRLEALAIKLAGLQGTPRPCVERVRIVLFAGDHGVAEEGVSAFPQSVTAAMLRCFAMGGSAVSVLAREQGAELEVLNLGTVERVDSVAGVLDVRVGDGTANFTRAPAMAEDQLVRAIHVGRHAAERAKSAGMQLFIGGEMGIANSTAATALASALLGEAPGSLVGPGAGLDPEGIQRKLRAIRQALVRHGPYLDQPWEALRRLGGFEIAALAGAFIACARMGLPVLVDGFICTTAALAADCLCPGTRAWFIYSHLSGEPGHRRVLQALEGDALLNLGMRLGEGSGAAVALPLLRLACSLHENMATFAEANVAGKKA